MMVEMLLLTGTIGEVKPIQKPGGRLIRNLLAIDEYVEPPLRAACRYLWNSGIRTDDSSAHMEEGSKETCSAYIVVNWRYLSEDNQYILHRLATEQPDIYVIKEDIEAVEIRSPITADLLQEEVSSQFLRLAQNLRPQIPNWAYMTEAEIALEIIRQKHGGRPVTRENYINALVAFGYYPILRK